MGGDRRGFRRAVTLLLMLLTTGLAAEQSRVAIIIDDLGYLAVNDRRALALDRNVAVAIIPDGPLAPELSRQAAEQQRDILIHLPLAGIGHDNCEYEAVCVAADWSPLRMAAHLRWATGRVEHAMGINNHQGSLFTADREAVRRLVTGIGLLARLHGHELFVVDSRTTPESVLEEKARKAGLNTTRRHVFLDHDPAPAAIEAAWERLLERARRTGSAVAIAHPHTTTLDFLEQALPGLALDDIELVPVSELLDVGPELPAGGADAQVSPP
jgi:uncharacterized protein